MKSLLVVYVPLGWCNANMDITPNLLALFSDKYSSGINDTLGDNTLGKLQFSLNITYRQNLSRALSN